MWGLLTRHDVITDVGRYTPTRVGTSPPSGLKASSRTVHPHACGDFDLGPLSVFGHYGTPPRVWGLRRRQRTRAQPLRYTPTRVGTSNRSVLFRWSLPVHPHACGDFADNASAITDIGGTPPRVWGLRHVKVEAEERRRYTPTRVGTSVRHCSHWHAQPVHPHACGDFWVFFFKYRIHFGTPPRVWGLLPASLSSKSRARYTPTRVGTSGAASGPCACRPVHPHACGDFDQIGNDEPDLVRV